MPTVSLDAISNGDASDATPVHNNFQELQTVVNGLDEDNWASGLIFAPSKFKQEGATSGQVPIWGGSAWAPGTLAASQIGQGGATTGQGLVWNGSAWAATTIGNLLGCVSYDPTTVVTATTTSTTGADIDAANLSLAVTVPAKILAVLNFLTYNPGSVYANNLMVGLREGTNNVAYRKVQNNAVANQNVRASMWILLTGLTPGTYTYKAAFKSAVAGTAGVTYGTQATPASTDAGPFTMAIYSVT